MINERFFLGKSVSFKGKFRIYPPLINDMIQEDFSTLSNFFTLSQEDIEDQYVEQGLSLEEMPTPFEHLMAMAYNDEKLHNLIQKAFQQFIHSKVTFFYKIKKIAIGSKEEIIQNTKTLDDIVFLEEDEFFDFQNKIRESMGMKPVPPYDSTLHPRIRAMQAKARYRDRVKAEKGIGISLFTTLSSICCMGIGINPLNIGELSYVAATELMQRYSEREKFWIDLNTIWAGADQKKHKITPKHWIRNLTKK